ncbi:unnamed protein product, partial [Ectocarpus sp. 12 AP-2014]
MIARLINRFKHLWAAAPVATAILILALLASTVFGVRSALFWHKSPPWAERSVEIAPWMSPRYISRSWRIPPEDLLPAINAPIPPPKGPMSLHDLAEMRDVPVEQVIAEVEAAIAAMRAERRENR